MTGQRCLIAILAVALGIRLVLAVLVQAQLDQPPGRLCLIAGDAEGYWELARKLITGQDYALYDPPRYVLRTPGFPAVLAASMVVFGENPFAARCILACLGAAACGLTYLLGRELVNETVGLLAASYTALSPTLSLFSVMLLSETTFAAAALLSLLLLARVTRPGFGKPVWQGGLAGIAMGLATLVRPTWLAVGVVLAGAIALRGGGSWKLRALTLGSVLTGLTAALAPWTIRNAIVTGHFVPTTLWVGPSLYDGLRPGATGDSDMQFVEQDQLARRMSEYDVDREYRRRAWSFVRQHPADTLWLAGQKQKRFWNLVPNASQFQAPWMQFLVSLTVIPLLGLAGIGFALHWRQTRLVVLTCGPILLFAAIHLLFVGSLRYRLPAEYPLAVMAALALTTLVARSTAKPPGWPLPDRGGTAS